MAATIKFDLRTGIAAISSLSSAGVVVDIDHNRQETRAPRVVVQRTSFDPFATLSVDDDSLISENFLVEVRGKLSTDAETYADAVLEYLQALRGNLGASRKVVSTEIQSVVDSYEPDEAGGDQGESVVSIDLLTIHTPQ